MRTRGGEGPIRQPPNKRLKLAGVIALKEAECCAAGAARPSSGTLAPASELPAA